MFPVIKSILLSKIARYLEKSLNTGCSFKDIARYLCKDPTTISKEIRLHRLSDWYHKGCFNNAHNFCIHRYHCKKVNACGKIILVVSNVPPVQPATRHVRTLSKNDVTGLIKHLMCVTGVQKQSITARLPTNTAMMLFLLIADTKNVSHSPEPV
ncbi:MAG: helix-turn-helix domain-containing protein [Lachnospiraceae bacterium]